MTAVVGVDIGTQGTKACLIGTDGVCLSTAFRPSKLHRPKPGHVEEDPADQLAAVCATIKQCVRESGIAPRDVAGVAIAGQMAGVIGIDAGGLPVTPYDSWLDTRCAPYIATLNEAGDAVLTQTGGAPGFNHGPKILWWKHRRTRDYAKIKAFVQPGGHAAMRLCGLDGSQAFIDATYLHFSGFAGNAAGVWDAGLCDRFGVDAAKLPRIARPNEIVGHVTQGMAAKCGLPAGTPVAAGCGDTAASFLAAGATRAGVCVDVAGTASVFAATTESFVADTVAHTLAVGRSVVPGLWHPYAYVHGGGMNLEWFRQHVATIGESAKVPKLDFDVLTKAAAGLNGSLADYPLFIPHLEGRAQPSQPALRGAWVGLNWSHNAAHLYRAVLEAVAMEYAVYQDALRRLYPETSVREVRVTGGGAASALWNTIKADVLQAPLRTVTQPEGAPRGAAMLAAWAVGLVKDLPTAAKRWVTCDARMSPNRKLAATYRQRAERYATLLRVLDPGQGAMP